MTAAWQRTFRVGLAPLLTDDDLLALRDALEGDSPQLVHGATTIPAPFPALSDCACEGACLIGYVGWKVHGLRSVGEVEQFFARVVEEVDQRLRAAGGGRCVDLLDVWDTVHPTYARSLLVAEVNAELDRRNNGVPAPAEADPFLPVAAGVA